MNTSWLDDCIMYQFYPLGLCGAPHENSWDWSNTWNAATRPIRRIDRVLLWLEQLKKLNVNAVYFSPVLQSDTHGYNTRDFYTLDSRLGSNEDFAAVCNTLHENGIRILFDSLFNHVGRGFWAFRDIRNNMQKSRYIDWFAEIDFSRNTPCSDGFYYKSYEDNWDFPVLNLENEEVVQHIFGAIRKWVDMFAIDGLRVGIADLMSQKFLRRLREFCSNMSAGLGGSLAILGEVSDPDSCKKIVNEKKAHASTNSELHSSIVNSVNVKNFFQLDFTLRRQFGVDGIYTHTTLLNFLDNHDITRFAQIVQDEKSCASHGDCFSRFLEFLQFIMEANGGRKVSTTKVRIGECVRVLKSQFGTTSRILSKKSALCGKNLPPCATEIIDMFFLQKNNIFFRGNLAAKQFSSR